MRLITKITFDAQQQQLAATLAPADFRLSSQHFASLRNEQFIVLFLRIKRNREQKMDEKKRKITN